jgi:phosphate transport system permease protein
MNSPATVVGGPERPARSLPDPKPRLKKRRALDRLAKWVVTAGGLAIILSILAILFVIVFEVLPLFKSASASPGRSGLKAPAAPLAVAVDEYREIGCVVLPEGIRFLNLKDGSMLDAPSWNPPERTRITSATDLTRESSALGLSDGRFVLVSIRYVASYSGGVRKITPKLSAGEPIAGDLRTHPIRILAHHFKNGASLTAVAAGPRDVALVAVVEKETPMGDIRRESSATRVTLESGGDITALVYDGRKFVYAGTSEGKIAQIDVGAAKVERVAPASDASITMLGMLLGERTLVVGDSKGRVKTWQPLGETNELTPMYEFEDHSGPVTHFAISHRDKGFLTADVASIKVRYGSTGKTFLTLASDVRALTFAPKSNAALAVNSNGRLSEWTLDNPHPEVSFNALFGKAWYEGYSEPDDVWQSTGGTDDFEAKFTLSRLIFGTIKGTIYALLIAVPLALLGALYTSQFMHPTIKGYVKPAVEIMAALPSVVLGFVAGLWLAPMVEKIVPALFVFPLVTVGLILASVAIWRKVPVHVRNRVKFGTEVFLLIPVVAAALWISLGLGNILESWALADDYRAWILKTLGLTYDQRNSLVVGFAMGFAVIPIIFTIAEDSLANVPPHLAAGSLALGATRWQTAIGVILPTASPGIFSAIMIGFGRAVGETMIVLMATGNTPVKDWSPFNGFRALSANIAVELPEAPHASTHYRVLFLAALLLFVMTFIVNTAAEVVRLRLRKKFQYL